MIKVEKMQVNNNLNPNTFLIACIFSFVLLVIFGRFTITNFIRTKDYVKVEATIVDVGYHRHPESNSYSNYIKLKYEYNNNYYYKEQRTAFRVNKKVGNQTTIYVNPLNPVEVRDDYLTKLSVIISVLNIIVNIFCINAYKIRKKE